MHLFAKSCVHKTIPCCCDDINGSSNPFTYSLIRYGSDVLRGRDTHIEYRFFKFQIWFVHYFAWFVFFDTRSAYVSQPNSGTYTHFPPADRLLPSIQSAITFCSCMYTKYEQTRDDDELKISHEIVRMLFRMATQHTSSAHWIIHLPHNIISSYFTYNNKKIIAWFVHIKMRK